MKSSWRVQSAMAHMHRRAGPGRAWLSAGLVPEWVALAAKAGRRFQKPPKAPRSATPAMPHRPLPISARCGSPSLYWPGAGVRHGPCMHNGHRTGPQAVVGHHRLLGKPCFIPQMPQGPLARQQFSPDGRNLKIYTFHSNRVLKVAFFVPKYTQRPPRQALAGLGSLGVSFQPMWGPGALGFDPGAALVAKSPKNTLFTQIEPQNHIICQEVRTSGPPARPQVPQGPQG